MQSKHTFRSRILSFILCLVMAFSLLPINSVFAIDDINKGDGTGGDGTSSSYPNRGIGEEGLRVTLFWVPLKGGQPDWSSQDNITQIGTTLDLRSTAFEKLNYGAPVIYGDFTDAKNSARMYRMGSGWNPESGTSYNYKTIGNLVPGKTYAEYEKNAGKATLQFPILFTSKENSTDPLDYFKHWSVRNEIMYAIQAAKWGSEDKAPYWIQAGDLETGMRPTPKGDRVPGQYLMTIENIIFFKSNGKPAGVTLREAIRMADAGSSILGDMATPITNMANSLYLTKDWPMLNLYGATGIGGVGNNGATNQIPAMSIRHNKILADQKLGVGVVEFTAAKQEAIPVIKYFYDLSTGKYSEEWKWETATNIVPDKSTGSYKAAAKEDGYTLVSGTVSSVNEIKGNIEQKQVVGGGSTQFLNKKDNSAIFTDEAIAKLQAGGAPTQVLNDNSVKVWGAPENLVTTVNIAKQRSALASKPEIIKANSDGTISFEAGSGAKDLQLSLLYVKGDIPKTHVTKLYYDDETTGTPKKIVVEEIPRGLSDPDLAEVSTGGYEIKNEDPYKVTNWTFVKDQVPNTPDGYDTWDKAQVNQDGKSGTSTGPLNDGWKDHELVIRYEQKPLTPEILPSELYLPERRISWHKSLIDLNGGTVPTITFKWAAITGHETHYDGCGSEDSPCPGHPCNESIGSDNFFRFVASNLTAVKSDIMGNKTNFMPYDKDNVYETTRGNSEGTYEMHPDYGFVIWRGKDIPTIASYKYGDTTGSGAAPSAPIIKNLIGETQAGISGKGARNPNNNGSYTDSFSINVGKSNYDTGNMTGFIGSFGGDRGTADGVYEGKINDFHTVSTQLKADIKALSEAESQLPTKN